MRRAVAGVEPQPFIGHVGGDDFVLVCAPSAVEALCGSAVDYFDDHVRALHDPEDVARGGEQRGGRSV